MKHRKMKLTTETLRTLTDLTAVRGGAIPSGAECSHQTAAETQCLGSCRLTCNCP